MAINYDAYETVVGLEVHAQLLTRTKLFCGDSAAFGGEPNSHVSPITLALPGSLPGARERDPPDVHPARGVEADRGMGRRGRVLERTADHHDPLRDRLRP